MRRLGLWYSNTREIPQVPWATRSAATVEVAPQSPPGATMPTRSPVPASANRAPQSVDPVFSPDHRMHYRYPPPGTVPDSAEEQAEQRGYEYECRTRQRVEAAISLRQDPSVPAPSLGPGRQEPVATRSGMRPPVQGSQPPAPDHANIFMTSEIAIEDDGQGPADASPHHFADVPLLLALLESLHPSLILTARAAHGEVVLAADDGELLSILQDESRLSRARRTLTSKIEELFDVVEECAAAATMIARIYRGWRVRVRTARRHHRPRPTYLTGAYSMRPEEAATGHVVGHDIILRVLASGAPHPQDQDANQIREEIRRLRDVAADNRVRMNLDPALRWQSPPTQWSTDDRLNDNPQPDAMEEENSRGAKEEENSRGVEGGKSSPVSHTMGAYNSRAHRRHLAEATHNCQWNPCPHRLHSQWLFDTGASSAASHQSDTAWMFGTGVETSARRRSQRRPRLESKENKGDRGDPGGPSDK